MDSSLKTVLIIDDSKIYRAILWQRFEAAGWRVFQADCGQTGLNLALEVLPAIIMCDMVMPNGDGLDVIKGVRADARLQATKIIMFTGSDDAAIREIAMQAGADGYLVKPVETQVIFSLIKRLGNPDHT